MLILNTLWSSNEPVITDSNGKEDYDFDFKYGEGTEVYLSCSVTWRGEFFIFGGWDRMQQVSKLVGCEMKRIGSLGFKHFRGACGNIGEFFNFT